MITVCMVAFCHDTLLMSFGTCMCVQLSNYMEQRKERDSQSCEEEAEA